MKKFLSFDQFVNEKYNYINEDETGGEPGAGVTPAAAPLNIQLGNQFPSGKWKLTPQVQQSLDAQFGKLADYIKKQGTSGATITINAGESKVPNKDAEAQPGPDGQLPTLKPGELAAKRSETVKAAIDQYLAGLKNQGIDTSKIQVKVAQPEIGGPDWKPGMSASDPQFTEHQFVNVTANASAAPAQGGGDLTKYAHKGESIYYNKQIFGTLHYLATAGGSGINTAQQPAILRLANKDGQYLNQYVDIPAGEAQLDFGTTNTVQSEQVAQKLKSQAKPVPQNDPLYGKTIQEAQY
jgi:hypothetical protein